MSGRKYRSKFEERVARRLGPDWEYELDRLEYSSEHVYIPDFTYVHGIGHFHLEVKGRFRTSAEARKYVDIRKCNSNLRLMFVFMNPNQPMPGARKRKDGTIYTHREWAEKNGFGWTTIDKL